MEKLDGAKRPKKRALGLLAIGREALSYGLNLNFRLLL
jgi:hypothetical protein